MDSGRPESFCVRNVNYLFRNTTHILQDIIRICGYHGSIKRKGTEDMKKILSILTAACICVTGLAACGTGSAGTSSQEDSSILAKEDLKLTESVSDDSEGGHAIENDGEEKEYSNTEVTKTGDSESEDADFYGENSAVFTSNKGTTTLSDMYIDTDGRHANAVFAYGEDTVVNISHSVIETAGNNSGGLMTTGGATMNAEDLTIHTTGNSSAAIRSDRGGGTVTVTGGNYTTEGTGSPVIYSTADITVSNANLTSTASEGVVVEGKNSVTLNDVDLVADNNKQNSDKTENLEAVMIYQSMSGDADTGKASFSMNGGTLTNKNGDVFFVNNTIAEINLDNAKIMNEDEDGVFLRAEAAGWGTEGSNGGQVTLNAKDQTIDGDIVVDKVSNLNLIMSGDSTLNGAVNTDDQDGEIYVELTDGAKWTLTADSYISSLTCDEDSIDLNGHKLYVDGKEYKAGTSSKGEAIEQKASEQGGEKPSGEPPEMGDGEKPSGDPPGEPPEGGEKPSGEPPSGEPPERPDDSGTQKSDSGQDKS